MKALVGAVILFGAVAQSAAAQDMVYSFAPTTNCLAEKGPEGEAHQCFGTAANACMENTPGGWSTVGMSTCLGLELQDWDRRLNRAYGLLMTKLKAEDEEMAALGSSAPKQAPALREMQRAWITFRDTSCDYERTKWGGGTGGGPAATSCHLFITARQAWSLEADLNAYGAQICNHEGC
ncbi:lysozyme inhibitor LprI family protein [Aliiroseovarius marinus]|uniref:lysozyme inhibitor LprI family protein n=1 Tax=Aliiroseovarius marinus TaxID=2500159 RepID=UPI00248FF13C|nr:lysozyme inhibitor LprI family protein [Aliiroseovarius marinus]